MLSPGPVSEVTAMVLDAFPDPRPAWYAAYTRSRHEKQIVRVLQEREVECFLPLYEVNRRNGRGRQRVFLPLFSSYVFVRIALANRLRVLQVPGIVQLVSFNGSPTALQEGEVESLQRLLSRGVAIEPYPYLKLNHEIEICSGPLQGLRGKVLRRKGRFRVVVSVDLLHRSVVADVDAADLSVGHISHAS